ncbi:dehydrogenase/reductase SDR family member 11-like [Astatotilapia calliptera]|uniref:dehydrogenase/reductase SDR family member 11-like n=1 Tax=Astatotilapia calliptera TaxID=8154 RepID=UPI000E3FCA05|nr:dehydrogenase/reductase SDR family member 11-like [Astatotilapia calliptera]
MIFYNATKYAVTALTEGLGQELHADFVETEFEHSSTGNILIKEHKTAYESNRYCQCCHIRAQCPLHVQVGDILFEGVLQVKQSLLPWQLQCRNP